jgi:hypothetical protein
MPKLNRYRVVREHYGDKAYAEGDIRDAVEGEVAHLVPHVLELVGPAPFGGKGDHDDNGTTGGAADPVAEKAETEPLNKAESAAPVNKAASQRKSKGK